MNRIHRAIKGNRHTIYLVIIVLAVGGSLLMMAIQGSRVSEQATQLKRQNDTLQAQVDAIKQFNEDRDEAVADLIADNARQTSYLECLLAIQGVPITDEVREECRTAAEERRSVVLQEQQRQMQDSRARGQSDQQPPGNSGGNGNGGNGNQNPQPEPSYTGCVAAGENLLNKLGRVISCL